MFRSMLILSALAIASLVSAPAGFMPMRSVDGSMILQICSGMKAVAEAHMPGSFAAPEMQALNGHDASSHENHDSAFSQKPCDYAVGAIAHVPPEIVMVSLLPQHEVVESVARSPLSGIFPPNLPSATGPPPV